MRVFSDFSPDVEALSLDEAFLDMTGSEQLFGDPKSIGRRLKSAIREATGGLTASVGLSATKYVAKVASACQKPDGLTVVAPEEAKAWLAPLSVSWLWGAGPKTQARLHQLGLHTIGDVANADERFLSAKLGSAGLHFHTLAQAEDPRPVIGRRASKSIGSEHTLDEDVPEKADIKFHLRRSADTIGRRLRKKNYVAFGVGVKLKTADFQMVTRQQRLSEPTDVAEDSIQSASLSSITLITPVHSAWSVSSPTTLSTSTISHSSTFSAPLLGNASWRWQSTASPSALVPTSCTAPTTSTSDQECVWRRP